MSQSLLDKVLACPRLPSLPAIALKVIDLCRKDDANINQIADVISKDPALSSKILKTVNSSYYSLAQPVSTISHALVILGLNSVRTLALSFSLVNDLKDVGGQDFDMNRIWRRTLYSAVGARSIAQRVDGIDAEETFLGALLQDLGVMALIQAMGTNYIEMLNSIGENHHELWELERDILQIDHTEIGEALAKKWKLPPVLISPIRYHEQPGAAPPAQRQFVRVVVLGNRAANVFLHEDPTDALRDYMSTAEKWFDLDPDACTELLETIRRGTYELAKLFEIPTGPIRDPQQLLTEANDVLQELTLRTQINANELELQNRQLAEKAITDPLTGAANRGHFNDFIRQQFDHARKQTQPLTMLLLDADHFKSVNDQHGHLSGDKVLVSLARTLGSACPHGALVARYGGEEFAIVAPNTNRRDGAQLAEQVRRDIEATPITSGEGVTLKITASVGVATFDGVRFFKNAEQLIKAADQAVYAAKASGRNCVRVFVPKVSDKSKKQLAHAAAN